jgi:hypothetical protein
MSQSKIQKFKRFVPLIGVFSFVAVSTALISFFRGEYALMSIGKTFMAMFFLTFGGFKLYNLEGFKEAFQTYDPLAQKSSFYAVLYPFLEVGLGLSYIGLLFYGSLSLEIIVYISTILIMGVNGAGVFEALINKRDLECACLGDVFNVPMTKVTLAEDLGMAAMAAVMLISVI